MKEIKIGIVGLGYVGLPLAVAFSKKYKTIGFDINEERIRELLKGIDRTNEISTGDLERIKSEQSKPHFKNKASLHLTSGLIDLKDCNVYIITVPTPIDNSKRPNIDSLRRASQSIGEILKKEDIVIYESTVYPGLTEEECVPILEATSRLKFNKDFYVGYSPERINPGDKVNTLENIVKVTSGSTKEAALKIDKLYKDIIPAGTYLAPSIKVAEAAKVIENTQRDINIAFINELSKILSLMDIDTQEVLKAAGTKWNFLKFQPGLVGGHCIGVDPYYLAEKAQRYNYHPEIILAGRRINDSMSSFITDRVTELLIQKGHNIAKSRVLILGITFKENCPDIRNSKSIDIIKHFKCLGCKVDVYDHHADSEEVRREFDIELAKKLDETYNAIILCVGHQSFLDFNYKDLLTLNGVLYDVKGILPKELVTERL